MTLIDVVNLENQKIRDINLSEVFFSVSINKILLAELVRWHMACKRLGTQSALTKSEVKGTTKKPFPQKGRGSARQGSLKNPHQIGGGVAFAPKPRDHGYRLTKAKKKTALLSLLKARILENSLKVVDNLCLDRGKTKELISVLRNLGMEKCLIVDKPNDLLARASRNLKGIKFLFLSHLNAYDIMKYQNFLISERAMLELQERFA
ncbi:MAG: 50S ribosomal protein L4 [Deltaproteobacteria bacterium]|nr:MAG: 50S ribosomal protein L4 [Deltaproteobacteria bacterium]